MQCNGLDREVAKDSKSCTAESANNSLSKSLRVLEVLPMLVPSPDECEADGTDLCFLESS